MAELPILQSEDPRLHDKSAPVPEELFGTPELSKIIAQLADALDEQPDGVAIAAPQLGIMYRIFLVRYDRTREPDPNRAGGANAASEVSLSRKAEVGVYINPEFVNSSRRRVPMDEGCLSVRGIYGTTERHERATVRAYDEQGTIFERGGGGLLAQIFQHETDHLNGILFIDHAVDLVRQPASGTPSTSTAAENAQSMHEHASARSPFVFFGTPYVARDTLTILNARGYRPSLIVTSPDSPRGRGLTLTPTEVKEWALAHNVPVITPEKITKEVIEQIRATSPGALYAIVVAYGKILPQALIDTFPLGILNIHYSLLPAYRGASPVETALLKDEKETGVSIQQMVAELDAGDVLASEIIEIQDDDTTPTLRAKLIPLGAHLLANILPDFEAGNLTPQPQDPALVTKCKKIKKEDGEIDPNGNAQTNWNKYRAYAEWPGTYFFVEKKGGKVRVKIAKASYKNNTFVIERVVPEGKKEQAYSDFAKNI